MSMRFEKIRFAIAVKRYKIPALLARRLMLDKKTARLKADRCLIVSRIAPEE